jgi:DNA helicase-2/ATP-dependent DNA helicase PcrA
MERAPYLPSGDRLLEDLNPSQREAVTHPGGPLLVVAGAGTGKTRVLTRRVAWLAAGGLPPWSILAITFTNKAAGVLRDRLADLVGSREAWAGTFHGFSASLLRRHGAAVGVDPDFTILDRDDQARLLRTLLEDLGPRAAGLKPAAVAAELSHRKNRGSGRPPLDRTREDLLAAFSAVESAYAARLRAGHLLDFDDLLLEALRLLDEDPETRERYRHRYRHVLVDEYQDTNRPQADLLRALLGPERNLTVVGDPDQSIYRWRGAALRNILAFEEEYPGAAKLVLERNYRSTGRILAAAEQVIGRNRARHAKRLHPSREEGLPVREIRARDADDEAEAVAALLEEWRAEGAAWPDMAVFYRVNALSRALEMALRAREIPYVIVAGVEFFERREVKDLLAYARLVENPRDEAAFLRVANVPRRGVGDTSLRRLRDLATAQGRSVPEAARDALGDLSSRASAGLADLLSLLDEARGRRQRGLGTLLEFLAERSGYRRSLEDADDEIGRGRVENVEELVAFARAFERSEPEATLAAFLERTALVADQDALAEDGGRVVLMSVHAAKGLEFPRVAIVGAEHDYFPHARSADDEAAVEEERRLFYVAMTRARDRLAITHAASRTTYRGQDRRVPSPFLRDVPAAVLEVVDRVGAWDDAPVLPAGASGFFGAFGADLGLSAGAAAPDVVHDREPSFAIGDRVRHPYFGEGWLKDWRGRGAGARVTVDFEAFGTKQLLLAHARLERIS